MRFFSKTITFAGISFLLAATPASAFNDSNFGGMAKFYAHNASKAFGKVRAHAPGDHRTNNHGRFKVINQSDQYNDVFSGKDGHHKYIGGVSGSRNELHVEWGGSKQRIKSMSKTQAKGAAGLTGRIRY